MIKKMPRRFQSISTIKLAGGGDLSYPKAPTSFNGRMLNPENLYPESKDLDTVEVKGVRPMFKKLDASTISTPNTANASLPSAPTSFSGRPLNPTNTFTPKSGRKFQVPDLSGIAPFASNIVNSFRKVPTPAYPTMDSAPSYQKVNMDDARYRVSREINATNENADRTLDSNTAQAVKQYNLGQKLDHFSSITEAEKNANAGIANRQADAVAQTQARNNAKIDEFNNQVVGSKIAQQREQSANLSNAADKLIGIRNERAKADLDREKTRTLSTMFSTDGPNGGLFNRNRLAIANAGGVDPLTGKQLTPDEIKNMTGGTTPTTEKTDSSTVTTPTIEKSNPTTVTQDRVPTIPKMAAGYPYSNTQLPASFTTPNSQLSSKLRGYSPKYRAMGGILKMKPVKC